MPWILEHPCDSWFWDVPKIEALAAQPRTAWALGGIIALFGSKCRKTNIDSGWKCGRQRVSPNCLAECTGTGGCCSVSGQKQVKPKIFASTLRGLILHVTSTPCPFIFHACHGSHHDRKRRFQRTHLLSGMWIVHSTRQRIQVWELLTLRISVDQNQ